MTTALGRQEQRGAAGDVVTDGGVPPRTVPSLCPHCTSAEDFTKWQAGGSSGVGSGGGHGKEEEEEHRRSCFNLFRTPGRQDVEDVEA